MTNEFYEKKTISPYVKVQIHFFQNDMDNLFFLD